MDSDMLTKGLQGRLFMKHRSKILGLENIDEFEFYRNYKQSGGWCRQWVDQIWYLLLNIQRDNMMGALFF